MKELPQTPIITVCHGGHLLIPRVRLDHCSSAWRLVLSHMPLKGRDLVADKSWPGMATRDSCRGLQQQQQQNGEPDSAVNEAGHCCATQACPKVFCWLVRHFFDVLQYRHMKPPQPLQQQDCPTASLAVSRQGSFPPEQPFTGHPCQRFWCAESACNHFSGDAVDSHCEQAA